MTRRALIAGVAGTLMTCTNCGPRAVHLVVLVDCSHSLAPDVAAVSEAVAGMVSGLPRCSRYAVVPVVGSAIAAGASLIADELACEEELFGLDVKELREGMPAKIAQWRATVKTSASMPTDILGALQVANQQFAADTGKRKLLVILSDMLQTAEAAQIDDAAFLKGVRVHVGLTTGVEIENTSPAALRVLEETWKQRFEAWGAAAPVSWAFDGIKGATVFVRRELGEG